MEGINVHKPALHKGSLICFRDRHDTTIFPFRLWLVYVNIFVVFQNHSPDKRISHPWIFRI
jgi:hypothetical protein